MLPDPFAENRSVLLQELDILADAPTSHLTSPLCIHRAEMRTQVGHKVSRTRGEQNTMAKLLMLETQTNMFLHIGIGLYKK